ncbi:MAG: error-prone DNA polymerase [Betaproteobacteria bacterium]|nr:error-prone DNA polymerase [Betaproteobacteria bacterium]
MQPSYAELHCISNFSFLRGASHPDELVRRAQALGYHALALTDECSVAGTVRAHLAAREHAFKLIIGAEFVPADAPHRKLVLLAQNRNGYGNLCELISLVRGRAKKGAYELRTADLAAGIADCLALLVGDLDTSEDDAAWLRGAFEDRAWLAVELLRGPDDLGLLAHLRAVGAAANLPLVAAGGVQFHERSRKALHDVLTAIRLRVPLAQAGGDVCPNSEPHLRGIGRLANLYPADLLAETLNVAARCDFNLEELRYEYPEELVPAGETPIGYLRRMTYAGAAVRYPAGLPASVRDIIEHELRLIGDMRAEAFFLTVYDIVIFARSQAILCQGRGSAANSAVCYCLGITEVDPARSSLLFERFMSKERNEPPDIDVDFEHERREIVMQYIYNKYGRHRAALAAALITYRPRSALRDAGRAFGLGLDQLDRLSQTVAWWDGETVLKERLVEAGFDPDNDVLKKVLAVTGALIGFPRHLSQHTGGFVIAATKLTRLVPVENAAMPERTVIQWDKDDLDAMGLLKVDVLALGMLTAIRRTLALIGEFHGTPIGLADIPPEDPQTYAMIQHADTLGVFQIESRAQMAMLPRLKPANFYDLVIEVALIRPGPIMGDMVHPYLRRRAGIEEVTYPSPAVANVLSRTLGVSIFQEQVMQLAVVAAGFTPGEADQLRRAMAAWKRRGGLEPFHDKFVGGMLANGYTPEYAEAIYNQIKGFGEYGFPESHAASFALLAYSSAWLKCHHPAAFTCGLLNSQPMGFYAPSQLVQDARRHRIEVRPADVTASDWDCTLERGAEGVPALRLGLRMIKGLAAAAGERIAAARRERPFVDVGDMATRARLDRGDLNALARADALNALAGHRRNAYWHTLGVMEPIALGAAAPAESMQPDLLAPSEGENIVEDYRNLSLTLRRHPLALLRATLDKRRILDAAQINAARHGQIVRVTGLVTCRQRPHTAKGVVFVTIEDETGMANIVVWSNVGDRQRKELLGAQLLTVYGHVERQGEVVHVIAGRLRDDTELLGRLEVGSRDFH